jgi:hypothetical protein
LALDPTRLDVDRSHGITVDNILRNGRVGYPVLAWTLSAGGQSAAVPWALIALNVAGLGAIGALGGLLAQRYGHHAIAGLLLTAYWGFTFTLSRDLSEIIAATATLGALVLLRDRRWILGGGAFALAVLIREQVLIMAGLLVLCSIVAEHHAEHRPEARPSRSERWDRWKPAVAIIPPVVALIGWNLVVRHAAGKMPLTSSSNANLGPPFVGLLSAMGVWLDGVRSGGTGDRYLSALNFVQLATLVLIVGLVARNHRATRAGGELWIAVAGISLFAVSLTENVLGAPASFRTVYDVYLVSVVALLAARRGLALVGALVPLVWVASALNLVLHT